MTLPKFPKLNFHGPLFLHPGLNALTNKPIGQNRAVTVTVGENVLSQNVEKTELKFSALIRRG